MGVEFYYQAIPDDCIILKKAKINPEYADILVGVGYLRGGPAPGAPDKVYEEFWDDVAEVNRKYPGIDRRNYTVDRCWDVLHFLLSEERRQGNYEENDLGTIAVYGATSASCLPDLPRYSSPSQVESVAKFLNKITESELLRWADPRNLENCYKGPYPNDIIWDYFQGLRNFYGEACKYNEAVVVNKL